jgi:DNA end-binding protein Ku
VVVTEEELEKLAPDKSRDIDLKVFAPRESIPPLYFEKSYLLTPSEGSIKAYRLLAETMEKSNRAGIATFVMRGKEHFVAIFADKGVLRAETMRFHDEIRSPKQVGLPQKEDASGADVKRLAKLIGRLSSDKLSVDEMRNQASEELRKLVHQKYTRGKDVVDATESSEQEAEVIDLIAQLKRSLQQSSRDGGSAKSTGLKPKQAREASLAALQERARELKIRGRSKMSRRQLMRAIESAA